MSAPQRKFESIVYNNIPSLDIPYAVVYPVEDASLHTASVIFLHGLGDNANNFRVSLSSLVNNPDLAHVKFIFPSAPPMNLSAAQNRITNSWFDCYSFEYINRAEDEEGLFKSVKVISTLIEMESSQHNIPSNRIIVGGISQGGAVSLLYGMTVEKPIAGLFALSTYVPLRRKVKEIATPASRQIPMFWGHGKEDPRVIHDEWKDLARTYTLDLGIEFHDLAYIGKPALKMLKKKKGDGMWFFSYPWLEHWMNQEELADLGEWMRYLFSEEVRRIEKSPKQVDQMDIDE